MGGGDKLFEQYLAARVPAEDPDCFLESLLAEAQPVVNRVVRGRLGSLYTPADAAELSSEAMLELLSRLRSLYDEAVPPANLRFEALAAGVAAGTVHRFHARRFPERNRLRKKIRYVVETGDRFRLWLGADGSAVCGLAGASPNDRLATAADADQCLERLRDKPVPAHPPALLVFEVLRALKAAHRTDAPDHHCRRSRRSARAGMDPSRRRIGRRGRAVPDRSHAFRGHAPRIP